MTGSAPTGVKSSIPYDKAEYLVSRRPLHVYPKVCAECGGDCCQRSSGTAYPDDFGRSRAEVLRNLRAALETWSWSVDSWGEHGSPPGGRGEGEWYYVRPAYRRRICLREIRDESCSGTCVFFEKNRGCRLPPDRRPTGCRDLIPSRGLVSHHSCTYPGDGRMTERACVAWWPYRVDIEKMIEEVEARGCCAKGQES